MKTRIIMIIALAITLISLILGFMLGMKKSGKKENDVKVTTDPNGPKVAKRVFNLIILDESGSMSGLERVCVTGVNETIQTIRSSYEQFPEQQQFLTFLTFSNNRGEAFRTHLDKAEISDVKEYEMKDYHPNGGTPLYDAMGISLTKLEQDVKDEDIVLVTVITDGYENSSRDFDSEQLKELIERLDKKDWVFTYIGANQDSVLEAGKLGIRNAMNFDPSIRGTKEMWDKEKSYRSRFMESTRMGCDVKRLKERYFNDEDED